MPLTPLFALILSFMAGQGEPVVIDGQFSDWTDTNVAVADPLDAPDAQLDIFEVRLTHDEAFVHVFADLTREVCLQQLNTMLHLVVDVDGDETTGHDLHGLKGADIVVTLSPINRSFGEEKHMGVGLVSLTYQPSPEHPDAAPLSPYDIGFTFGPTYASSKFEFRMERSAILPKTPTLFVGDSFRMKLVLTSFSGEVLDETDVMEHELTVAPVARAGSMPRPLNSDTDPLAKQDPSNLRVMSLNAQHAHMLDDDERAGRIMRALKPDVILLQELTDRTRADDVESLLNRHAPPAEGRWQVRIGEGGGNLRCGIATHLPFEQVEALRVVGYPDRENYFMRQAALLITHQEHTLLAVSIHLRCCGGATGREEETRMVEVQQLRNAMDPLRDSRTFQGIVIGGDFNLVGTRRPLDMLAAGGDLDGSNLTPAQPLQLDRRSNATWSDPSQPFVPGRLDYVVTSDATLDVKTAFVFDTADLAQRWLMHHDLMEGDSIALSDHRPVVVDLAWKTLAGPPEKQPEPADRQHD